MYYSVTLALLVIGIWMLVKAMRLRKRQGRVGSLVSIGMLLTLIGGLAFAGGVAVSFR